MTLITAASKKATQIGSSRNTFIKGSAAAFLFLCVLLAIMRQVDFSGEESSMLAHSSAIESGSSQMLRRQDSNSKEITYFDRAAQDSLNVSLQKAPNHPRTPFQLASWTQKTTGGLSDQDRTLLGRIYGEADSLFEWGLGESTWIASHVGVPRYAGIDSDAIWVANARDQALPHFRFYLADIGKTGIWGYPEKELPKASLDYQLAPMLSEQLPFDVYMVDGRYRLACMLIAFLHASARGGDPTKTRVLFHDCTEQKKLYQYRKADSFLNLVEKSGDKLCVYMRKADTTDQQIYDLWRNEYINTL